MNEKTPAFMPGESRSGVDVERIPMEKPARTASEPNSNLDKAWLQLIETKWPQLSRGAINALESQENPVLNPALLSEANLKERFQFRKSDIRLYIINMGTQKDMRAVFRFFQLGQEIDIETSRKQHEEKFFEVSRLELLQIYVAIFALLGMSSKVEKRKRRHKPNDEFVMRMIEKLMTERPKHGGPLMTVR